MTFIANFYTKVDFLLTDTTKQTIPFERKSRISEIKRSIKQDLNVSYAETVNQATKYFLATKYFFTKYLPHTLHGHILHGLPSDLS